MVRGNCQGRHDITFPFDVYLVMTDGRLLSKARPIIDLLYPSTHCKARGVGGILGGYRCINDRARYERQAHYFSFLVEKVMY